jgi:GNAT superfamily N-acetyltransferase
MRSPPDRRFDASYREDAALADGTRVEIRLVGPAHRDLLRRGFQHLSPGSRYLRFFTDKPELSEAELDRLTTLDGVDQLALGAVTRGPDGVEEGLGIARFSRDPRDPALAEAAVTVVDHAQRKGLGRLLLTRLAAAAAERGITAFSCEFLARNQPVRRLIEEHCPDARLEQQGDTIRALVPLPKAYPLFRQVAAGRIVVNLRRLLLKNR